MKEALLLLESRASGWISYPFGLFSTTVIAGFVVVPSKMLFVSRVCIFNFVESGRSQ